MANVNWKGKEKKSRTNTRSKLSVKETPQGKMATGFSPQQLRPAHSPLQSLVSVVFFYEIFFFFFFFTFGIVTLGCAIHLYQVLDTKHF